MEDGEHHQEEGKVTTLKRGRHHQPKEEGDTPPHKGREAGTPKTEKGKQHHTPDGGGGRGTTQKGGE